MPGYGITDEKYAEWTQKSRAKLKPKIKNNYEERRQTSIDIINRSIHSHFPNSTISTFAISESTTAKAIKNFYHKVDSWRGVDLTTVKDKGKLSKWEWKDYHQRADNWWNRYKAAWIGDFLFYPLFHKGIDHFIEYNGCEYCEEKAADTDTKTNTGTDTINYNHELLKFMLIKDIMNPQSLVKFDRSRKQPLILDQSYTKSELEQLFKEIGQKYDIEFNVRSNTAKIILYVHITFS